jgi:hypothetical protein
LGIIRKKGKSHPLFHHILTGEANLQTIGIRSSVDNPARPAETTPTSYTPDKEKAGIFQGSEDCCILRNLILLSHHKD